MYPRDINEIKVASHHQGRLGWSCAHSTNLNYPSKV